MLVLYLALAGTLALPAAAQRFDHDEVVERSFKARPGQTLVVDADLGSIELRGGGDEVRITVVKGANDVGREAARELFDRYEVDFKQTSRGVEVRGRYDRGLSWRRNRLQVRYRITVPERFDVDLKTAGGSIEVVRLDGAVRLATSGGALRIDDVAGPVEAHTSGGSITARRVGERVNLDTSGGSITAEGIDGPVAAKTSGGSISIADVRGDVHARTSGGSIDLSHIAGSVDAHTSGGSIQAEIIGQIERPVRLDTSGGSVTLRIDPGMRADLDAKASGGRVRLDLPVTVRGEVKRDRIAGALNGGGPRISLHSSGGGVSIRSR